MNLTRAANLTGIDRLMMLVYFMFVLGIGFAVKRLISTSNDFPRSRFDPASVCGLKFISANLGAQEVILMGASGAKYGIITSHFYSDCRGTCHSRCIEFGRRLRLRLRVCSGDPSHALPSCSWI